MAGLPVTRLERAGGPPAEKAARPEPVRLGPATSGRTLGALTWGAAGDTTLGAGTVPGLPGAPAGGAAFPGDIGGGATSWISGAEWSRSRRAAGNPGPSLS